MALGCGFYNDRSRINARLQRLLTASPPGRHLRLVEPTMTLGIRLEIP